MTDTNGRLETAENFCGRYGNTTHGYYDYAIMKKEIIARDASVAHAARVGVLREIKQRATEKFGDARGGGVREESIMAEIAARHGITPSELEPEKGYTERDIQVQLHEFVAEGLRPRIACGEFAWAGAGWTKGAGFFYKSQHDAEAIAAKLRADKNVPAGGGK